MGFDSPEIPSHFVKFLKKKLPPTVFDRTFIYDSPFNPFLIPALARVQTLLVDGTSLLYRHAYRTLTYESEASVEGAARAIIRELRALHASRGSLRVIVIAFDKSTLVPLEKLAEWDKRDVASFKTKQHLNQEDHMQLRDLFHRSQLVSIMRTRDKRDEFTEQVSLLLLALLGSEFQREEGMHFIIDGSAYNPPYLLYPDSAGEWTRMQQVDARKRRGEGDLALVCILEELRKNTHTRPFTKTIEWYGDDSDYLMIASYEWNRLKDPSFTSFVHLTRMVEPSRPLIDVGVMQHHLNRFKYLGDFNKFEDVGFFLACLSGTDFVQYRPPGVGYVRLLTAIRKMKKKLEWRANAEDLWENIYKAIPNFLNNLGKLPHPGEVETQRRNVTTNEGWFKLQKMRKQAQWHYDALDDSDELFGRIMVTYEQAKWQVEYFDNKLQDFDNNRAFDFHLPGRHPLSLPPNPVIAGNPSIASNGGVQYTRPILDFRPLSFAAPRAMRELKIRHGLYMFRLTDIQNASVGAPVESPMENLSLTAIKDDRDQQWYAQAKFNNKSQYKDFLKRRYPGIALHMQYYYNCTSFASNLPLIDNGANYVDVAFKDMRDIPAWMDPALDDYSDLRHVWYMAWTYAMLGQIPKGVRVAWLGELEARLASQNDTDALEAFFFLRNGNKWMLKRQRIEVLEEEKDNLERLPIPLPLTNTLPLIPGIEYVYNLRLNEIIAIEFKCPQWTRCGAGRVIMAFYDELIKARNEVKYIAEDTGPVKDQVWAFGRKMSEEDLCRLEDLGTNHEEEDWNDAVLMFTHYHPAMAVEDFLVECGYGALAQHPPAISPYIPPIPSVESSPPNSDPRSAVFSDVDTGDMNQIAESLRIDDTLRIKKSLLQEQEPPEVDTSSSEDADSEAQDTGLFDTSILVQGGDISRILFNEQEQLDKGKGEASDSESRHALEAIARARHQALTPLQSKTRLRPLAGRVLAITSTPGSSGSGGNWNTSGP